MPKSKLNNIVQPGTQRGAWRLPVGIIALVVGLLVVAYPFLPALRYAIHRPTPTLPYVTNLNVNSSLLKNLPGLPIIGNKPVPLDNRIIIPRIGVDIPILEGPTQSVLDRGGIWHIPNTSNPTAGGNFVLSGHRWQYLPPSSTTLYLLDKVQDQDPIIIYWEGQEYDYRVTGREIVSPDKIEIQAPTDGPRLTIYTCTPLYSTKYRLVLYGQLMS
jgi:LPXTG-site transpeptidase (sortase) family protein